MKDQICNQANFTCRISELATGAVAKTYSKACSESLIILVLVSVALHNRAHAANSIRGNPWLSGDKIDLTCRAEKHSHRALLIPMALLWKEYLRDEFRTFWGLILANL